MSTRRGGPDGILLLYHNVPPDADTILEHVRAFENHSRFPVWTVNTDHGFPPALERLTPSIILLHYSLFGTSNYCLDERFLCFLDRAAGSYRIAFFQDENQDCPQRFRFVDRHRVDCIYTLLEPAFHELVYGRNTHGPRVLYTIPGYVSDDLVATAARRRIPDARRRIDIGYRSRSLPFWMGRGSQEKREIGIRFRDLAPGLGLRVDIEVDEGSRLYGAAWTDFLANSRGVLGVEAGVSIFDLEDSVRPEAERLLAEDPSMTFDRMSERLLGPWEGTIPYRTVSPRHFEAAAFQVVQILFEGRYSGVLEPMIHYLPLSKDFSNIDEVVGHFRDPKVRQALTERAYQDLIASGRYSYRRFIEQFDSALEAAGFRPSTDEEDRRRVARMLRRGTGVGRVRAGLRPHYRRLVPLAARLRMRDAAVRLRGQVRSILPRR